MTMRKTHERRELPPRFASKDSLPRLTPIIGDIITYETWAGDIIHPHDALARMRGGKTVYYVTWEDTDETARLLGGL